MSLKKNFEIKWKKFFIDKDRDREVSRVDVLILISAIICILTSNFMYSFNSFSSSARLTTKSKELRESKILTESSLPHFNKRNFLRMGKLDRILDIDLAPVLDSDQKVLGIKNGELKLQANIQLRRPINSPLYLKWIVREGFQLKQGKGEETLIPPFKTNESFYSEVILAEISENDQIKAGLKDLESSQIVTLQVYTIENGIKIGNSAVYNPKRKETLVLVQGLSEKSENQNEKIGFRSFNKFNGLNNKQIIERSKKLRGIQF